VVVNAGVPENFRIEHTAAVEWLQLLTNFSTPPAKHYCLARVNDSLQSNDSMSTGTLSIYPFSRERVGVIGS